MNGNEPTCIAHLHVAMQFVYFTNRRFGKVIISESRNEAYVVANALMAEPSVLAIYASGMDVWLN